MLTYPDINALVKLAIQYDASDIHLPTASPPLLRILGDLSPIASIPTLTSAQVLAYKSALFHLDNSSSIALSPNVTPPARTNSDPVATLADFSCTDPSTKRRFRINAFETIHGPSLAIRVIPSRIRSLDEIQAPAIVQQLAARPGGLVLVTGPTGSGKSATMAAMIDLINHNRHAHILTLEDPVEYLHDNINCLVSQREIHRHARGYAQALKDSLRDDPDVILVGEMRDPETIRLALTAAETGHLVLSTLHTRNASQAVDRIIDVFPAGEKEIVRAMLAESLQGVIAQQLVKHRDGKHRLAVFETMINTPAVRNCIKDGQTGQIRGIIHTNKGMGMMTFEQALQIKIAAGEITQAEAATVPLGSSRLQ